MEYTVNHNGNIYKYATRFENGGVMLFRFKKEQALVRVKIYEACTLKKWTKNIPDVTYYDPEICKQNVRNILVDAVKNKMAYIIPSNESRTFVALEAGEYRWITDEQFNEYFESDKFSERINNGLSDIKGSWFHWFDRSGAYVGYFLYKVKDGKNIKDLYKLPKIGVGNSPLEDVYIQAEKASKPVEASKTVENKEPEKQGVRRGRLAQEYILTARVMKGTEVYGYYIAGSKDPKAIFITKDAAAFLVGQGRIRNVQGILTEHGVTLTGVNGFKVLDLPQQKIWQKDCWC